MHIRKLISEELKEQNLRDEQFEALGSQLLGNINEILTCMDRESFFEQLDDLKLEMAVKQGTSRTSDEDEQDLVAIS